MGVLSVTVNNIAVSVHAPSTVVVDDKQGGRSTATLTVVDTTSTTIAENHKVVISDSVEGTKFSGVIDTIEPEFVSGTTLLLKLTCKDKVYFADKRLYTGAELTGRRAGDVATQLHEDYLAAEGITATYSLDHDRDITTFGAGTQSGTVATASGLQLSPAGTTYTVKEDTTSEFASGTLTNTVATNNTLTLTSSKALKLECMASTGMTSNPYLYVKFFTFSGRTVASGDTLNYDLWISMTSPEIKGGLDLAFTDGTILHNVSPSPLDQRQLWCQAGVVLNGLANDQWYSRTIFIPDSCVGKTVAYCSIAQEGDKDGTYTIYVRHVKYKNGSGTTLDTIFESASSVSPTVVANQGYESYTLSVVTAYDALGTRVSPAYTNTACTVLKQSLVSWEEVDTVQTNNTSQQVTIETSFDNGFTWQTATNHAQIASLIAGMSVNSKSFKFRQTLTVGGSNPELSPVLKTCQLTLSPSYTATKSDVVNSSLAGGTSMGTGTLTRLTNAASGLAITGVYKNWDDGDFSGATGFTSVAGTVAGLSCQFKSFGLRTSGSGDGKARFDFAGQHQNFTAEIDVDIHNPNGLYGLLYRTTSWVSANDTYGYFACLGPATVVLGHGSNSTTSVWTQIAANTSVTFDADSTHRLKVIANGSSHQVYVDDVLIFNVTDTFYTGTGYLGVRYFNDQAGTRQSAFFDNFGVVDDVNLAGGSRVWPSISISSVGIVENSVIAWNASTSSATALDIQASTNGGTTYTSCTNGGVIPGCEQGVNVSGKSLLIKAIFTSQTATDTPLLYGLTALVVSDYQSSGTRTSPALAIGSIGRVGSTSLAWVADTPTGTTVTGKTSTDNVTYTSVASGDPIVGINSMQDVQVDDFAINNAANWVSAFYAGGAAATWTWDTTNSRMTATGGTTAVYSWTPSGFKDGKLTSVVYASETGGLIARFSDVANHYRLRVHDSSAGTNPNSAILVRRVAGTNTTLSTWTLPSVWTRNSYHTVVWEILGNVHTVWFDGAQVGSYTEPVYGTAVYGTAVYGSAPLVQTGNAGLFTNGGTASWQSLFVQGYGDDVTGKSAYSQVVLTSSDPTKTPTVSDLTLAARGPHLITGATIPGTGNAYKKISDCVNDAAKASNGWWNIDVNAELYLQNRMSQLAPWPLTDADFLYAGPPRLVQSSPAYRNKQYVTGAYDIVQITEQKVGDGITQSWALSGKVVSISAMDVNGRAQAWGVANVDTGKDFYYTPGDVPLAQDKTEGPLTSMETLTITYTAQVDYTAMAQDTTQQALLAARDSSTGIVEVSEAAPANTNKAEADAMASARIAQYAVLAKQWNFSTQRMGLKSGQWLSTFVPEFAMQDVDTFITGVKTTYDLAADSTSFTIYDVTSTSGPPLRTWTRYFINNFS